MSILRHHLAAVLTLVAIAGCSDVPHEHNGTHDGAKLPVSKPADPSLIHRYSFTNGAKDSAGTVDGVLKNSAKITGGKLVLTNTGKLSDDAALEYLEFPAAILPRQGSVSIVTWYTATTNENFARIFDIGDRDGAQGRAFLYLIPRNAGGMTRARITATDTSVQKFVEAPATDDGQPHSVAVVLDAATNRMHLFIDGKEPAGAVELETNNLAAIRQVHAWLGRSGFDQDPGLTGSIDELRVYSRALTLPEAAAIHAAGPEQLAK